MKESDVNTAAGNETTWNSVLHSPTHFVCLTAHITIIVSVSLLLYIQVQCPDSFVLGGRRYFLSSIRLQPGDSINIYRRRSTGCYHRHAPPALPIHSGGLVSPPRDKRPPSRLVFAQLRNWHQIPFRQATYLGRQLLPTGTAYCVSGPDLRCIKSY